jgi:hypothetical protein
MIQFGSAFNGASLQDKDTGILHRVCAVINLHFVLGTGAAIEPEAEVLTLAEHGGLSGMAAAFEFSRRLRRRTHTSPFPSKQGSSG